MPRTSARISIGSLIKEYLDEMVWIHGQGIRDGSIHEGQLLDQACVDLARAGIASSRGLMAVRKEDGKIEEGPEPRYGNRRLLPFRWPGRQVNTRRRPNATATSGPCLPPCRAKQMDSGHFDPMQEMPCRQLP